LIVRENGAVSGNGAAAPGEQGGLDLEIDTREGLGELIVVAFFCAACWVAVALLVVATIVLRSGWLTPVLVALALVAGVGVGLFPTLLYRRDAKLADAGMRALAAELPEQVLADARAREPRSLAELGGAAAGRIRRVSAPSRNGG
jgi:hypothetical protein